MKRNNQKHTSDIFEAEGGVADSIESTYTDRGAALAKTPPPLTEKAKITCYLCYRAIEFNYVCVCIGNEKMNKTMAGAVLFFNTLPLRPLPL